MFSDAIPHGFNELDTLLDAQAQDFFKLGWTHVSKFTPAPARMQSVRITLRIRCVGRAPDALDHRPPTRPSSPACGCSAAPATAGPRRLAPGSAQSNDVRLTSKEPWYHADPCGTTQWKGGAHETHLARRPSHAFQDSRGHGQGRGDFSLPHLPPCNDRRGS